jgi:5-bromo-4-chloroindolyl phosphate hydrolysis protein
MPTQANYDHIKNELLEAKKRIEQLEKNIKELKQLKKVSFPQFTEYSIEEISPDPQLVTHIINKDEK